MKITFSERLLSEQIRQLENLDPATTVEEISFNMHRYFRRLAEHVTNYGVTMDGTDFQQSGNLATMGAVLNRSYSDEDVVTRLNGLRMLNPLAVALEPNDLPSFVTDSVALVALEDAWGNFGREFQRLTVNEIRPAIERVAMKVLFAPSAPPSNDIERMEQEQGYEMFLARAGKRDPLARHQAVDEYNRAEIARVQAEQEAAYNRFVNPED
jgi:hypothetical protein